MRTNSRLQTLEELVGSLVKQAGIPRDVATEPMRCEYYQELPSLLKIAHNDLGFKIDAQSDRVQSLGLRAEITDKMLTGIRGTSGP